ncbi:MAG: OOP family OmpA-OmpF porin [Cryomorphaceae bacterium]|jgi:outer membrane protein OmpA-like peptidoglycan-associated protein
MPKGILIFTLAVMLLNQAFAQQSTISFSTPQKLPNSINSSAEEGLPILSSDLSTLYFARTFHPDNSGGKNSGQDIWTSSLTAGEYSNAESVKSLNNEWSNAVVGVTNGGNKLYLLNEIADEKGSIPGLSTSEYNTAEKTWSAPTALEIPGLEILGTFYSAYVAPDESFILWTLPTSDVDSLGNDLYVSTKSGDMWEAPMSFGAAINTSLNEISPYFDPSTELLFFSTNGRESNDNYDIYYSKRIDQDWSNWTLPVKADFNSDAFDAYFFMAGDSTAYFSSNRNDSLTNLYLTEVNIESLIEELTAAELDSLAMAENGLKAKKDPVLIIEIDGKETTNRTIESLSKEEVLAKNTVIRFVYFEFDKFNITAQYVEVLDDVATILDNYQDILVRINGHTDAVASEAYNQVLSENRAASTKEWLMINGVEPDRIKTEGFGKREPYASNLTEEGRSLNRRVEIFFEKDN